MDKEQLLRFLLDLYLRTDLRVAGEIASPMLSQGDVAIWQLSVIRNMLKLKLMALDAIQEQNIDA